MDLLQHPKEKKTSPPSEISSPLRLGVKWIKINSEGLIVCIFNLQSDIVLRHIHVQNCTTKVQN